MTSIETLADLKIIFVVGSVRSGTSIVGQALDHVFGADKGFFEGNVIGMVTMLADALDQYYAYFPEDYLKSGAGNQISEMPKDWMRAALQQQIVSQVVKSIYQAGAAGGVWVDKSPDGHYRAENVRACGLLAALFPQAKFVFCRRHGGENVASRMRKWPQASFINQCYGWAGVIDAWAKVRAELAGRYVEVDQTAIAFEPERVADELGHALGATGAQREALLAFLTGQNVEQTSESRERPPRPISELDWDLMRKWTFLAICGPSMSRYRYEIGATPVADPRAPVLTLDYPDLEQRNLADAAWAAAKLPGGFQLHPFAPAKPPPTLVFRNAPAWPRMRLRGALVHGTRQGVAVVFRFRVTETGSGREIFNQRFVAAPGEAFELDEPMTCASTAVDVEVTSTISPWQRAPSFAWGRVVGLSLTPAEA